MLFARFWPCDDVVLLAFTELSGILSCTVATRMAKEGDSPVFSFNFNVYV